MREIGYAAAIAEALREEMERDESVFLIGEDIGSVREAKDLFGEFRRRRVFQTPISESAFTGLAVGAAAAGLRPVVEIMYCDFVTVAMDQICNQAAKLHLMSGGSVKVPLVIKTPAGCGTREGAHHSQSLEAWFVHTPGLKVALPATPYDAKGLLKSSIRDDGPVVFIQHRLLHPQTQAVPDGEWLVPLGQAAVKREGADLTVVAISNAVHKALRAAEALADEISLVPLGQADVKRAGHDITLVALSYAVTRALAAAEALSGEVSVEVVDPRTLVPLDVEIILASVGKTGRLLVVHEAPERGGAGAEIVRRVVAEGMDCLVAPPMVLGGANIPMPYSPPLEDACIPQVADIARAVREMMRA
ncbi:MAG: alpha-ketoacid dehydrogenase subunit beta [Armatimonadota bacterium]